ncbi:hypothetical protein Ocin01_04497 [Orchesella cincta]|uniref:CHK kinase-like domain-containing protein n=1 Tax=Orchesella cincta TaxID=48709 RepID=A0A1D2NA89_ORCCI|nr:hypothetical protein Ocin01_04497 [Orchesella cincta]
MSQVKVEEEIQSAQNDGAAPTAPGIPEPEIKPEDVITPTIISAILDGYNHPELSLVDFQAKQGTMAGDNYMSIMYSLNINLKNATSGDSQALPVMLKVLPRNEFRLKMIRDANIFVRDVNMYKMVLPSMEEFQKKAGFEADEIIRPWPTCYACKTDGENDFLAMEDLKTQGFKMANRKEGLDFDHSKLFVTTLAKFHAISFAMFMGEFDAILEKYPWLEESMYNEDKIPDTFKLFIEGTFTQHANMLKEVGEEKAGTLVGKICNADYYKHLFSLVGGKVPFAVIGHGDCWTNNLMFRYDPETNKPVEIKFVDYQVSRVSSRAVDIHYFLYTSPQVNVLNEKEDEILKVYFDEFTKFVRKLGVDTDAHGLTKEDFDQEIDKFRFSGVISGLMLASIMSAESADVPDMESLKEEDFTVNNGEDAMKNLFLNMLKERAMEKIKNIANRHLPRCAEMKQYLQ